MTHSKLDIDEILKELQLETYQGDDAEKTIRKGSDYIRARENAKQALLEAFEQSLNTIIGEDEPHTHYCDENEPKLGWCVCQNGTRSALRQSQRNEAIKVIRGNHETE